MTSVSNTLQKPNSRIAWVDIAKAVAMFFIVLGHVDIGSQTQAFAYSFHVPVFVFLSGYCFSDKDRFSSFLKKKLLRIMVPYFFFGIFAIAAYLLLGKYMSDGDVVSPLRCFYGLLVGNVKSNCMGFNLHLWFLPFIFSMSVIFYGIKKLTDTVIKKIGTKEIYGYAALFVITFIVSALILNFKTKFFLPLSAEIAVREMPFFSLGFMIKYSGAISSDLKRTDFKNTIAFSAAFIVFTLILIFCAYKNINHIPGSDFAVKYNRDVYGIPLYFYGAAFAGIGSVVCLSKLLPRFRWIMYFGRNTLAVLVMQKFFTMPMRLVLGKLPLPKICITPAAVIFSVAVIVLCLAADWVIKKYLPFIYGMPYNKTNKS